MDLSHREIFERYVHAGPLTRDPAAVAALFTEDGVYEAPLLPADGPLPPLMTGRDAIREGVAAYHRHYAASAGAVDLASSSYVLHETADPDVFIAEIDTVLVDPAGQRTTMSLVQIFRVRDGLIAKFRDYFAA